MNKIQIIISPLLIMFCTVSGAQEITYKFEEKGELIKGTYYYEDGSIKQEGTYKNGKLHGEWVSYGQDGEKNAIAKYEEGNKSGKWFFRHEGLLTEINYKDGRIAEVRKYNILDSPVPFK